MNQFLWGALAMSGWIAGLFFLKFWRVSGDRLFVFFFLAFSMLALNWLGLALVPSVTETRHQVFILRLLAFVLIIVGVVDKNRRDRPLDERLAGRRRR
jgi:hypothetical protein